MKDAKFKVKNCHEKKKFAITNKKGTPDWRSGGKKKKKVSYFRIYNLETNSNNNFIDKCV